MRKIVLFNRSRFDKGKLVLILFFFLTNASFGQGVWTWMSGTDSLNAYGIFGTRGVASVNNRPPSVFDPYCWTDLQGNFWLFGGYSGIAGDYADMWKFNPNTLEWTWMNGHGIKNVPAVYGTQGVADTANTPGSRWSNCTWVDKNGDLWLFGGLINTNEYVEDMWKYNIASNKWTWMSGTKLINALPVYGTLGVPSAVNTPGCRNLMGSSWVDTSGNFWIFAGKNDTLTGQSYADVWMYNPVTNFWTWESGPPTKKNVVASYGTQGVFSSSNTPGGRCRYGSITEKNGNFLLVGGYDDWAGGVSYADTWEYNPNIKQWTWVAGSQSTNQLDVAGNVCQSSNAFYPGSRFDNSSLWKDQSGNIWMYGGGDYIPSYDTNLIAGDVWVFINANEQWARVTPSEYMNTVPVYGTKGVPAGTNQPGARFGQAHWVDKNYHFWVFGGLNFPRYPKDFGDMWMYVPDTNCIKANCLANTGPVTSTISNVCAANNNNGFKDTLTAGRDYGHLQWYFSTDALHYSVIPGDTTASITVSSPLMHTTYYRLSASDSHCSDTSSAIEISLVPSANAGSISASVGSLCKGSGVQSILQTTGYSGSLQWQSSTDSINFSNLPDTIYVYITPGYIAKTTWYRVVATNICGADTSVTKKIIVNQGAVTGVITASLNPICLGTALQSILSVTGNSGHLQWQSASDSIHFFNLANDTTATYATPATLTQTTWYRLVATSSCGKNDTSGVKKIMVSSLPATGIVTASPGFICTGSSSKSTLSLKGNNGRLQWQSSTDSIHFSNLPGDTLATYTTSASLTQNTWYRVLANNSCGSDTSVVKLIIVEQVPSAGVISRSRDSICAGSGVTSLLSSNNAKGNLEWQSSVDGIHFSNLAGGTSSSYKTPPSLSQTTWYRLITANNCGSDTSNTDTVHIIAAPVAVFDYTVNGKQVVFNSNGTSSNVTYYWDFADSTNSNIANPTHNYNRLDTFYVCLTVNNGSNCSYTYCKNISLLTGIKNVTDDNFIHLYPNPANNSICVSIDGMDGNYQLRIYNVLGQQLKQQLLNLSESQQTIIDLQEFAGGTYELVLVNDKEYHVQRFIHVK